MKIVRLEKGIVKEILPEATYEKGVAFWYGEEFASHCETAPDTITQGMRFEDGQWLPPEDPPQPSPAKLREGAYANDQVIEWDNQMITVDEANVIFLRYFAENDTKASAIQALIISAKASIRELYPDEEA